MRRNHQREHLRLTSGGQMKRFMPVVSWIILTPLGGVRGWSTDIGCVGLIECSGCDVICDPLSGERSLSLCVCVCFFFFSGEKTHYSSTHYREVENLESEKVCWSNRTCPLHFNQFKFRSSAKSKFMTRSQWLWSLSVHTIPWGFCGFCLTWEIMGFTHRAGSHSQGLECVAWEPAFIKDLRRLW